MLVQPWVVPGGCKPFAVRSGGAFDESSGRRREGVREVEAACPPFVALCRDAVMVATRCAAVFLTAVAEGGVICVEVPSSPVWGVKEVKEEAVVRPTGQVRLRVVSGDKAGKVVHEALPIERVIPVNIINGDCVFKPQKAVNVS